MSMGVKMKFVRLGNKWFFIRTSEESLIELGNIVEHMSCLAQSKVSINKQNKKKTVLLLIIVLSCKCFKDVGHNFNAVFRTTLATPGLKNIFWENWFYR